MKQNPKNLKLFTINGEVNVSKIPYFGGAVISGNRMFLNGFLPHVVNNLMVQVEHQLKELGSL